MQFYAKLVVNRNIGRGSMIARGDMGHQVCARMWDKFRTGVGFAVPIVFKDMPDKLRGFAGWIALGDMGTNCLRD